MTVTNKKHREKRKYYRHPVWAPLRYEVLASGHREGELHSSDVCLMGLRFTAREPLPQGALLRVVITLRQQEFELITKVEWQRQIGEDKWDTGVSFLTESNSFKARMLEQVIEIEEYRKSLSAERGSEMTFEQAARLWIEEHANEYSERFPP